MAKAVKVEPKVLTEVALVPDRIAAQVAAEQDERICHDRSFPRPPEAVEFPLRKRLILLFWMRQGRGCAQLPPGS